MNGDQRKIDFMSVSYEVENRSKDYTQRDT